MQTKLKVALCVVNLLINVTVISGCIYEQKRSKTTIHTSNEIIHKTKQQIKEQPKNNIKTIEIETDKEVDTNQAVEPVSLGEFKLTGYCSCSVCCNGWANNRPVDENGNEIVYGAIGEELKEGYSIAVDPDVIPYRTEVIIDGNTYKAQDCGGAINGNRIDVYFENHQKALEFGVRYAEVFIKT